MLVYQEARRPSPAYPCCLVLRSRSLPTSRPGQDLLGALRPHERLGALLVRRDEALDGDDELRHAPIRGRADLLAGEDEEPVLDEVHRAGARGREVEAHALVAGQLALYLRRRVRPGTLERDAQRAFRELAHHGTKEGEELLVTVAREALADDLAADDLEVARALGGRGLTLDDAHHPGRLSLGHPALHLVAHIGHGCHLFRAPDEHVVWVASRG